MCVYLIDNKKRIARIPILRRSFIKLKLAYFIRTQQCISKASSIHRFDSHDFGSVSKKGTILYIKVLVVIIRSSLMAVDSILHINLLLSSIILTHFQIQHILGRGR
jgi:hypothetical protein